MKPKFVRRDSHRFSKIGKNRKKLQKWRGAKGRDNKIRLSRKGYPKAPSVGYKKEKSKMIKQFLIYNLNDLEKADKNSQVIIANIGARKKIEIVKKALEMKLSISNFKEAKK
jgi:large subunit ribosomal protein L32e